MAGDFKRRFRTGTVDIFDLRVGTLHADGLAGGGRLFVGNLPSAKFAQDGRAGSTVRIVSAKFRARCEKLAHRCRDGRSYSGRVGIFATYPTLAAPVATPSGRGSFCALAGSLGREGR